MTDTATGSDMDVGLAMLFGAVTLFGAIVMYLGAQTKLYAATGFALAIVAGSLAIGALHVYEN